MINFTVPVASRVDSEVADQITYQAELLEISFSKMLSIIIYRGINQDSEDDERSAELEEENNNIRNAVIELIRSISDDEEEVSYLCSRFNELLINEN